MIQTLACTIPSAKESYTIEICNGLLSKQEPYLSSLASRCAIITDDTVALLYGGQLHRSLSSRHLEIHMLSFASGEQNKTRTTKELLENQLFEKKLGRDTCIVALGGGVVTDIAGYIAATYCRGIPLVLIPTSLLGMVDASIGGKTGINVPYGKNMLGCIYQPKKVIIDPLTLISLPKKELSNGFVEMIKHGLIADACLFDNLEQQAAQLLSLHPLMLEKAIFESCRIKKEIIEQDEKEQGKRRLLNFGHTVGHALEKLSHYTLAHGEAVAIGLLVESYLSVQLHKLSQKSFDRIRAILAQYGLPFSLPLTISIDEIMDAMILDKKSVGGRPRFVTIEEIGSPIPYGSEYCTCIEEALLKKALQWMKDDLCRH